MEAKDLPGKLLSFPATEVNKSEFYAIVRQVCEEHGKGEDALTESGWMQVRRICQDRWPSVYTIQRAIADDFGRWGRNTRKEMQKGEKAKMEERRRKNKHRGQRSYAELEADPYSPELRTWIESADFARIAAKCKERAGHRCELCNATGQLEAHHRSYATVQTMDELEDLTCLCRVCHRWFHDAKDEIADERNGNKQNRSNGNGDATPLFPA